LFWFFRISIRASKGTRKGPRVPILHYSQKGALREAHNFLKYASPKKALREEKDPRPKGHSEGGKLYFKYTSQKKTLREEKDPRPRSHFGSSLFGLGMGKWDLDCGLRLIPVR
jgi:hypothetical protein